MVVTVTTVSLQAVANANKDGKTMHVFGLVPDLFGAGSVFRIRGLVIPHFYRSYPPAGWVNPLIPIPPSQLMMAPVAVLEFAYEASNT